MKKLLSLMMVIVITAASSQTNAAPKGKTLAQFLEMHEEKAKRKGKDFTAKARKAKTTHFTKMDANKDGVVTGKEANQYFKDLNKNK